ncbi:MAG: hypothetical protein FWF38_00390 [Spirochaetaceae bacterium]|nr:hypothetical protein [Spirochaetaceae bacterium]
MKLFLVKIGRTTRRGNFEELYARAVAVSDDCFSQDVNRYFAPKYKGFKILLSEVDYIDISKDMTKDLNFGQLEFVVKYTDEEKKLSKEYTNLLDNGDKLLNKLHDSIDKRYSKLPYVPCFAEIRLNTYYGETRCALPIKSNDFFEVVKNGDGCEELKITSNEGYTGEA